MNQFRKKLKLIIFGTDTLMGKLFDITLIALIISSVIVVLLDSVKEYHINYGILLNKFEIVFTTLFTIEYLIRIVPYHIKDDFTKQTKINSDEYVLLISMDGFRYDYLDKANTPNFDKIVHRLN